MKYGTSKDTALHETIRDSNFGGLQELKAGMRYYDFESKKYDIFEDIADGDLGYLMVEYEARYWVSEEYARTGVCGMHVTTDSVYTSPAHFVFRANAFPQNVIDTFNRE